MKNLLKALTFAAILLASALPVQARLLLQTGGEIQAISNSSIVLDDTLFKLSPTVKIFDAEGKRSERAILSPGKHVFIDVYQVGKKRLVDSIRLQPRK